MNPKRFDLEVLIDDDVKTLSKTDLPDYYLLSFYKRLANREIFWNCDVDTDLVDFSWQILEWNREDKDILIENRKPIIIFTASGGARMQEGIFSLMQMVKTSAAIARHNEKGCLYITVLTDPTTGGITASFAMLGDIILSEPNALIGFAGQRVIEQTIKQRLPEGFQRAEFLLEKGFIDKVVDRKVMKDTLTQILKIHS